MHVYAYIYVYYFKISEYYEYMYNNIIKCTFK